MPVADATTSCSGPSPSSPRLVRSGRHRARELVQASLDRIEALDGEINAFVDVYAEDALAAADAIGPGDERPFAGVPIAIKNNRARRRQAADVRRRLLRRLHRPTQDHNVTRRLREAGFVIVGSTTLPEFGILPCTETKRFGPTRNPWDLTRTPGGSSGGSGAAVAAGMVPLAHGNDGGGSTRIPAACCGLVGLQAPARAHLDGARDRPQLPDPGRRAQPHRRGDRAAARRPRAATSSATRRGRRRPAEPFAATAGREPGRLRIGFTSVPPIEGVPVDPVCAQAVTRRRGAAGVPGPRRRGGRRRRGPWKASPSSSPPCSARRSRCRSCSAR